MVPIQVIIQIYILYIYFYYWHILIKVNYYVCGCDLHMLET